ncbi:unnamed protein product, partial [Ectocarpus sp. 12 AP-2014]
SVTSTFTYAPANQAHRKWNRFPHTGLPSPKLPSAEGPPLPPPLPPARVGPSPWRRHPPPPTPHSVMPQSSRAPSATPQKQHSNTRLGTLRSCGIGGGGGGRATSKMASGPTADDGADTSTTLTSSSIARWFCWCWWFWCCCS